MNCNKLKEELVKIFNKIGVKYGRTVFVQSELISFMDAARQVTPSVLPELITDSLLEAVGDTGTVVVPTFTTDCARKGVPFDLVHTPCDTGLLANYLRCLPDASRSLHPVLSVCALGRLAKHFTKDISRGCYCLDSPFDRMALEDTIIVRLGMAWNLSNTFSHYIENRLSLPYLYNKVLDFIKVSIDGLPVDQLFYMSVRYLDFDIQYDHRRQIEVVAQSGFVRFAQWGGGTLYSIELKDYMELLKYHLKKDSFFLLARRPSFRQGERPFDGSVIKNLDE